MRHTVSERRVSVTSAGLMRFVAPPSRVSATSAAVKLAGSIASEKVTSRSATTMLRGLVTTCSSSTIVGAVVSTAQRSVSRPAPAAPPGAATPAPMTVSAYSPASAVSVPSPSTRNRVAESATTETRASSATAAPSRVSARSAAVKLAASTASENSTSSPPATALLRGSGDTGWMEIGTAEPVETAQVTARLFAPALPARSLAPRASTTSSYTPCAPVSGASPEMR